MFFDVFIAELGDLDKVKKIVKLTGFVNCVPAFPGQPQVLSFSALPHLIIHISSLTISSGD